MAKTKAVPRKPGRLRAVPATEGTHVKQAKRRNYEYDHHYGMTSADATKAAKQKKAPKER
jgi:hypothetical protein